MIYVELTMNTPVGTGTVDPDVGTYFYEGNEVVDAEVTGEDQAQLTTWYTERAVKFIDQNKNRPFFLYVP